MSAMEHVQIRTETHPDIEMVQRVVETAFIHDSAVGDLLSALRRSSAWRSLSFVAEIDADIVGHACFTRGWLDAPAKLVEVLVLSPMSVVPAWQRKGIGKALITESIRHLEDR